MTDQEHIDKFIEAHKGYAAYRVPLHKITKIESLNEQSKQSEIHNDYWTLGHLMEEVKVGSPIFLARIANSNYPSGRSGVFSTSEVVEYKDNIATTKNSKYKIEKLVWPIYVTVAQSEEQYPSKILVVSSSLAGDTIFMSNITSDQQEWYPNALEVLVPLRWHVNELVEMCEQYNRFAEQMEKLTGEKQVKLSKEKIEAARKANNAANKFFSFDTQQEQKENTI